MKNWAANSLFYQIFPLGLCGAPSLNDFIQEPSCRLNRLLDWIKHLKKLEVNAVYLGPVFESTSHGYDTADYLMVDRRLGTNEDLARIIRQFHANNIKVVLDAVFNHVGRDFWAFKDVQCNKRKSPYQNWFSGLNFQKTSPYQDPFAYDGWNNHFNLVKLNLKTPAVKQYLFEVVQMWINTFQIDGLRLDAADCLDMGFISELSNYCKKLKNDFWLLGEVIHGDYTQWIKAGLDSITNYECYKGLWSSFNDVNLFEIAYSLNRQFGDQGIYKKYLLYSFADNHDVTRVASVLNDKSHLYPLYLLLFTMPGIPSLYYGSEWGIEGLKTLGNDANLRPVLDLKELMNNAPEPDLEKAISHFSRIRQHILALQQGNYQQIIVDHQQLVFSRCKDQEYVIIAINSADQPITLKIPVHPQHSECFKDLLSKNDSFKVEAGIIMMKIWPNWGRILIGV